MDTPPHTGSETIRPRPDYPPKTPPPPKRPPSPPSPETCVAETSLPAAQRCRRGGRPVMRNRPGGNWTLEAQPWAVGKAYKAVSERLAKWGLEPPAELEALVRHLVRTVLVDGGRQVSVHLAEQDGRALILALGHLPWSPERQGGVAAAPLLELDRRVMREVQDLGGVVSCGTEMTEEGRQIWALLDLTA